jgi:RecB family exonuclease
LSKIQPTLQIASSTQVLLERRRQALAASASGVVLGRHFLTLRGVAEACAHESGAPVRGELDAVALARIVRHGARNIPALGTAIAGRPGTALALAGTLRDLRDAGVPAFEVPDRLGIRRLYQRVEQILGKLEQAGLYDRVGLFRLAARRAEAWLARMGFSSIHVHGATELVGSAGDLIQALHDQAALRFEQADWGDEYAAELRRTWPWRFEPRGTPVCGDPLLVRDATLPDGALRSFKTADPHEELEFVAHEILRRLERGADPSQICVVARSLEAYAPWIVAVCARYEIPFTSSLSESVLHRPAVRVRLNLARALFGNLERDPTLDLLRSPRFRWKNVERRKAVPGAPALAEVLARRGRVLRDAADWLRAINNAGPLLREEQRSADPRTLDLLRRTIKKLDQDRSKLSRAKGWAERAQLLSSLSKQWLCEPSSETDLTSDALAQVATHGLGQLDTVDRASGATAEVLPDEFLATVEATLQNTRRRAHEGNEGGVRILDALQARAIPTGHLFLLGINQGSWPLDLRDDPFLPGPMREQLRRRTGRPIPSPRLQEGENRFLLGLLLSGARESVTLTWHERDFAGRECLPSTFLRQLPGIQAKTSLLGAAEEGPAKPSEDFLHASDALVHAAIQLGASEQDRTLPLLAAEVCPERAEVFTRGLVLIRATEAWTPESLWFDGVVGAEFLDLERTFSPSFLETLGQCPQRAFFSGLLRVGELQKPSLHELGPRETGTVVHGILHLVYQQLFDAGELAAGKQPEETLKQARELLPQALAEQAAGLRERWMERHPALWQALERQTINAVTQFMRRDLEALLPRGLRSFFAERDLEYTHSRGEQRTRIRGKADRVLELSARRFTVSDYKTRADTQQFVSLSQVRRGARLQIPLYILAIAEREGARDVLGEVLAVPVRPERVRDANLLQPRSLTLKQVQEAATPSLDALSGLLHAGRFPFRSDGHCWHCPYVVACRKGHVPSEERVRGADAFSDYFSLHGEDS